MNALVGTPAEVVEQIHALRDAGVQELMLHWNDTVETDGLQLIAEEVLPHVR
jgi:alkanesulfonate monooxygenase SsuD/methylene tetrahydromethanopterin reductase-like flavin-dependent oxidoreductase (luciferase family)